MSHPFSVFFAGKGAYLCVTDIGPHFLTEESSSTYKTISRGFHLFSPSLTSSLVEVPEQWIWKKELGIPSQDLQVLSRDWCSDLLSDKGKQSTPWERSHCGAVPEIRKKVHLIPGEALPMTLDHRPKPPSPNNFPKPQRGNHFIYTHLTTGSIQLLLKSGKREVLILDSLKSQCTCSRNIFLLYRHWQLLRRKAHRALNVFKVKAHQGYLCLFVCNVNSHQQLTDHLLHAASSVQNEAVCSEEHR